jgi:serine/threonine-protein kinase PknK
MHYRWQFIHRCHGLRYDPQVIQAMRQPAGWGIVFRRRRTANAPALSVPGFVDLELVGKGGFSKVYRARQEAMQRTVALKVLDTDLVDDRDRRRFARECQAAGRLTGHPHVVTVFDADVTRDGRPYIVMEYCEQGSFATRLRRSGPVPLPEALATGVKLCGALAAAHAAGILHCDVKPQNVLMNRFGRPALADFGVAIFARDGAFTATTAAITVDHAPPEVLEANDVTTAGDVYSLGSTIYTLLAGRAPFHAEPGTPIAGQLLRVLRDPVPELPRGDIPVEVSELLRVAMARDPKDRPASALEFGNRLRRLQAAIGLAPTDIVIAADDLAADDQAMPGIESETVTSRPNRARTRGPTGPARAAPEASPILTGGDSASAWDPDAPATVLRAGSSRASSRKQPRQGRSRRGPLLAAMVGVMAVVAAGALLIGPFGRDDQPGGTAGAIPSGDGTSPSPGSRVGGGRPGPSPSGLTVEDRGSSAVLRWRLPDARFPLVLLRHPGPGPLVVLEKGSTSTVVDGLDRQTGYCFRVGTIVGLGQQAWSSAACIRGARPSPPPSTD